MPRKGHQAGDPVAGKGRAIAPGPSPRRRWKIVLDGLLEHGPAIEARRPSRYRDWKLPRARPAGGVDMGFCCLGVILDTSCQSLDTEQVNRFGTVPRGPVLKSQVL